VAQRIPNLRIHLQNAPEADQPPPPAASSGQLPDLSHTQNLYLPDQEGRSSAGAESAAPARMDVVIRTASAALRQRKLRLALIFLAIGAGLLAVTVGLTLLRKSAPRVERSGLWIDTVQRGRFSREVRGAGTLISGKSQLVVADVDATVVQIVVDPGAVVKPGDLLFKLASPDIERQVREAEYALRAAQADVTDLVSKLSSLTLSQEATVVSIRADLLRAQATNRANEALISEGTVPDLVVQESRSRVRELTIRHHIERRRLEMARESAANQIAAQRSRIAQLETARRDRAALLDGLMVKASRGGVIQSIALQLGQRVTAGLVLGKIGDLHDLQAEIRVPEAQAKDIRAGQKATVDSNETVLAGKVVRVDPSAENGTVRVVVAFDQTPQELRPDQTVNGSVLIESADNVVFVGRPAFAERGATLTIFKLDSSDRARRVPVQIGRVSVNTVEIASGLEPGDQVILSDMSAWDSHSTIRLK
jgi:HlyD family secretion protein